MSRRIKNVMLAAAVGERDEIFDAPRHEYTRTLLAAVPRINPEWDRKRRDAQKARDAARSAPDDGGTR